MISQGNNDIDTLKDSCKIAEAMCGKKATAVLTSSHWTQFLALFCTPGSSLFSTIEECRNDMRLNLGNTKRDYTGRAKSNENIEEVTEEMKSLIATGETFYLRKQRKRDDDLHIPNNDYEV